MPTTRRQAALGKTDSQSELPSKSEKPISPAQKKGTKRNAKDVEQLKTQMDEEVALPTKKTKQESGEDRTEKKPQDGRMKGV